MKCAQCQKREAIVKVRLIDENNRKQWICDSCYDKTARETRVEILDDRDGYNERMMQDKMMGGR